ncbi:MAG: leucine-rich repeat domain-containing protein, partial [Muribaculaceae bacterium]|nr:leucine-rich repeat domain-containing protein [Muribaculaceae bacterium]
GLEKAEFASVEALCKIDFSTDFSNPLYYAHNLSINGEEIKDLVIPAGVTSIGDCAFQGCSGLTSVTIPSSVTTIGEDAFRDCSGLEKAEFASVEALCKIDFKDTSSNPLYCAHNLYINGKKITDLVIPAGVTSIGNSVFSGCSGLTSVTIPPSVTTIGRSAFFYCRGLKSVTIPEGVTSIGSRAFENCSGLTSVYYGADKPINANADIFSQETYKKAILYMSEDGVVFSRLDPWKNFRNIEEYDFSTGIDDVITDFNENAPYEIYNINGVKAGDNINALSPGLYIIRQGKTVKKIMVK